jgi:hypothetical protein
MKIPQEQEDFHTTRSKLSMKEEILRKKQTEEVKTLLN